MNLKVIVHKNFTIPDRNYYMPKTDKNYLNYIVSYIFILKFLLKI
jgi:hypothetical protein